MDPDSRNCHEYALQRRFGEPEDYLPTIASPFCSCPARSASRIEGDMNWILKCRCGENPNIPLGWIWEKPKGQTDSEVQLLENGSVITFHSEFSHGTAMTRGNRVLTEGIHYWEVKLLSPVYGTDIMVGVGRRCVELNQFRTTFRSALGADGNSWGLSYRGDIHHNGRWREYSPGFGQSSVVGCLLDLWHGTLSFYLNRKPMGIAFCGLRSEDGFFPLVSSTAARSGMRLICAECHPLTLQFLACRQIRESITKNASLVEVLKFPPGLQISLLNNMSWLMYRVDPTLGGSSRLASRNLAYYEAVAPYRCAHTPPPQGGGGSGGESSDRGVEARRIRSTNAAAALAARGSMEYRRRVKRARRVRRRPAADLQPQPQQQQEPDGNSPGDAAIQVVLDYLTDESEISLKSIEDQDTATTTTTTTASVTTEVEEDSRPCPTVQNVTDDACSSFPDLSSVPAKRSLDRVSHQDSESDEDVEGHCKTRRM